MLARGPDRSAAAAQLRRAALRDAASDIADATARARPRESPPRYYRITLVAGRPLVEKLAYLTALLSGGRDDTTLAEVLELAVDALLEDTDAERP